MTVDQMREICVRELLFGRMFLSDYERELMELSGEPEFLQIISRISDSVPESLEFSLNPYLAEFIHFKKEIISDAFYRERLLFRFPAYCDIVDSVVKRGQKKLSATISVYYAVRYLMLSRVAEE